MKLTGAADSRDAVALDDDPPPVVEPVQGFVCKACGQVLESRASTVPTCDGDGPHAPVLVDLRTLRRDVRTGMVLAAVHLE